jgi:hypothetical protein
MMMMMTMTTMMGQEYIWRTVWVDQQEEGRGKEWTIRSEKDGSTLHINI